MFMVGHDLFLSGFMSWEAVVFALNPSGTIMITS